MTIEDIDKAGEDYAKMLGISFSRNLPHLWVDFALDMVRRHNEELQNLAWPEAVVKLIQKAKP